MAITLCAHTSLGTQPIYLFGTEEQRREWLPQLCPARSSVPSGSPSPRPASDAGNTKTTARLEGGEWVIDGAKQFITNAGTDISGIVVHHREDGRARAAGRDLEPDRRRTGRPATSRARRTERWAGTRPTRARSPSPSAGFPRRICSARAAAGLKQFLQVLDIGRIGVAAMGVGLAQGAFDEALAYAKERRAFGQPISRFQAIQAKLADMATEIEAARLLVYKSALQKDRGEDFSLTAAQAKLKTGRLAVRCAEEAVQIHGGYGYIEEYPVCRFYRDAKILTIGEGTDEIQQMVIARALGA